MMQTDNIYEIHVQSSTDVKLPENSLGNIFIIGNRSALADKVSEVRTTIVDNLDKSSTFYHYKLRILDISSDDCNIICPIQDPVGGRMFYVVAKADTDELDFAIPAVINVAETELRKFSEEALMMAAMEEPELFKSVVDRVIVDGYGDDNSGDGISPFGLMPMGGVAGAALGMALGIDDFNFDLDECASSAIDSDTDFAQSEPNIKEASLGIVKGGSQKPKIGKISEKQRKEAFSNLPKKLSNAFEKQNPESCEIVNQTIALWSATEQKALFSELAKEIPWLLQKLQMKATSAASRYEIYVRPWKSAYKNDFKDRYLYCIYLKNAKGKEKALTFKNYPAYCIYMMYIIDRVQRGEEVTDLTMKGLRNEFCELYKTIISETDKNINSFFDGLEYRFNEESGMRRKGRYDDYIKDIHYTLENLVGEIDSIPLKVGHGRYLGILPERIHIDEKLTKFKFA